MPKLKRKSASKAASEAKKRKEIQREDPLKRQQERQRDSLRHLRSSANRDDSYSPLGSVQRRRERNTETHQISRLDSERRREEQIRDTAAHRTAREDPRRIIEEQQRDLLQHREARSDPEYRAQEQHINNARRQQVRESRQASFRALNYQADNFLNTTYVGTLSEQCQNCGALKFSKETEALCCSKGNIKLDAFPQPQPFLQHLYEGVDSEGRHLLTNIRKYNCAFQMTSFGCNEINITGFNPSFRIQGQVYHLIGSITPTTGESPKFSQIYFIDWGEPERAPH